MEEAFLAYFREGRGEAIASDDAVLDIIAGQHPNKIRSDLISAMQTHQKSLSIELAHSELEKVANKTVGILVDTSPTPCVVRSSTLLESYYDSI